MITVLVSVDPLDGSAEADVYRSGHDGCLAICVLDPIAGQRHDDIAMRRALISFANRDCGFVYQDVCDDWWYQDRNGVRSAVLVKRRRR